MLRTVWATAKTRRPKRKLQAVEEEEQDDDEGHDDKETHNDEDEAASPSPRKKARKNAGTLRRVIGPNFC